MNEALVRANWCADFTVFVGSWMLDLLVWREQLRTPHSFILNGADAPQLTEALKRHIQEPELRDRMGERGAAIAAEELSSNRVIAETLSMYIELLP